MDPYKNFAITRVEPFASGDLIIEVPSGAKSLFPNPEVDGAFDVTVWNTTDYELSAEDPNKEIIRITGNASSTTYNILRAQQDTVTRNHNLSGKIYKIARTMNAKDFDDINPDNFEVVDNKVTSFQTTPDDTHYPSEKLTKDSLDSKQDTLSYTPEDTANKKTDLTDNSDTYYPSQKAVKTAVDAKLDSSSYTPVATIYKSNSITSSGTPAPTGDGKRNEYYITALAEAAEFAAPSGTAVNGNMLFIRIKDNGEARALTWNAIYEGIADTLPSTTTISKTMFLLFAYNSSKWQMISLLEEE